MKPRHRHLRTSAFAALVALAPLATACGTDSTDESQTTLRTIQGLTPSQFDPCGSPNGSETAYMAAIYAPLIRTAPDTGELSPGIATDWEFSNELQTLTLTLQTGLRFQDGTTLDAEAAKRSIEQCLDMETQRIPGLESISAEGEDTLVFDTSTPNSGLPALLGSRLGMLASPTAREERGEEFGAEPVGAGPFQLDEFVPGSSISLTSWDEYQEAGLPEAKVDRIESEIISDPSAQEAALTGGQADFGWRLDYSMPSSLEGTGIHVEHNLGVSMSDLNIDRSQGPLQDKKIRQALSYAIDREALAQANTSGLSDVGAVQPYPPGHRLHFDELDDTYEHDPDKARELLDEAGHPDGLTLRGVSLDAPSFVNNGVVISEQLAEVGIEVDFEAKDVAEASKDFYVNHEYDLISTGMNSGPDWLSIYRRILTTESSGNSGNVPVPGGEEALERASSASSDAELEEALKEADEVIQEELPIIPLYYSPTVSAWGDNVTGGEESVALNGEADLTALGLR
ncbi:ABC transporter substrate-binding protein [Halostreptopolyspora alba]|uniref:Solute-binding protein family 5 domain-containing protein n=1 Tax=Halostreptopolyspora alba TaxID=2487137 RepID=A0A3N0EFG3_9ACTN|nr:hypothetical protein EFW17_05375 [Nocardiopsaceae bacterium YIM 96095]